MTFPQINCVQLKAIRQQFIIIEMGLFAIIYLLTSFSSYKCLSGHNLHVSVVDPCKINAQNSNLIVIGNNEGDIYLYNRHARLLKSHLSTHSSRILSIQRYQTNQQHEYVTVDDLGSIKIWDQTFNNTKFTLDLNVLVVNTAVREDEENNINLLAINIGEQIIEFSLNQRSQMGRYYPGNTNGTFLSVIYLKNHLVASDQDSNLLVYDNNGTISSQYKSPKGNIKLLSKHQHDQHRRQEDGIGVANGSYLIHYDVDNGIDQFAMAGKRQITLLSVCRAKGRRQKQDLFVLGSADGTVQIRSLFRVHDIHTYQSGIVDLFCKGDELLLLDKGNNIHFIDLDHFGHRSGGKMSYMAAVVFAVAIVALVVCQIIRKRRKRLQDTHGDIELKQRFVDDQIKP